MRICFTIFLLCSLLISGCAQTTSPTPLPAQSVPTLTSLPPATPTPLIFTPILETSTTEAPLVTTTSQPTDTLQPTATPGMIMVIVSDVPPSTIPQPQVCQRPQNWVIYKVQRNDTLSSLGQRTGTSTQQIQAANCLTGTLIFAGQPLYLPFIPAQPPVVNNPSSPSGSGSTAVPIRTPKTGLPGDHLVTVSPMSGPPGTSFTFSVDEYASGEKIIVSIIFAETGDPVVEELIINADQDGNAIWSYKISADAKTGDYNVFEDGTQSKATGKGHFSITAP